MKQTLIGFLRRVLKADSSRICIGGYAGCGNLGDDAILEGYLHHLRQSSSVPDVIALTGSPRSDRRRFFIPCYQRKNPFSVLYAFLRSGEFLCGGGSLLQNATGNRSLFYYLVLLRLARACGCRVSLLAAGIGPVDGARNIAGLQHVLHLCHRVEVRDPDSMRYLLCLGVPQERLTQVPDPSDFLPLPPPARKLFLLAEAGIPSDLPYFCVVVRGSVNSSGSPAPGTLLKLSAALRHISRHQVLHPVFFVMDSLHDSDATRSVCREIGGTAVRLREPSDALAILSGARFLLSMRLHALFFADRLNIPAVALAPGSVDPKIASFCRTSGTPLLSPDFSVPELVSLIEPLAQMHWSKAPRSAKGTS